MTRGMELASTAQLKAPVNERVTKRDLSDSSATPGGGGGGGCCHCLLFNSAPSQPGFSHKFFFETNFSRSGLD